MMFPAGAIDGMNGNDFFELLTGKRIVAEPAIDRLVDDGRVDPCEAEGWSMGDCMDALAARIARQVVNLVAGRKTEVKFLLSHRRSMLEAIDMPEECRFNSTVIKDVNVERADAPPHIHGRRCNWTRHLCIGYDENRPGSYMFLFVFYENCVDSACYAGNITSQDIQDAITYLKHMIPDVSTFHVADPLSEVMELYALAGSSNFKPPDATELAEKKRERNRAKRLRQKERKRELAAEKAEEEAERERERKEKDDGIDGIDKGKKGVQQLAEEEAARRRKELAEAHREWERLHPKQERIVVRGESHKETPKMPKPEPTMEEQLDRMNFEEQRGDRQLAFQEKQKQEHQAALERRNAAKEAEEKKIVKEAGMRIAQAANPKAPPLTLARAAGI